MSGTAGLTRTERILSGLGGVSFLKLWSYPNPFRGRGTELCDLLVVCGNIVLIFSDKEVGFGSWDSDPTPKWKRWYNRAVLKSVKQLRRAKNWIQAYPDKVFFDAKAERKIALFDRVDEEPEIHLIAVANGASQHCIRYFGRGSGSLVVDPDQSALDPQPFTVGNPGGDECFVHVFNEANLQVMLRELDTITDFRDYLVARRHLIVNKNLHIAASEEDLLAVYLQNVTEDGRHGFSFEDHKPLRDGQKIAVYPGLYDRLRSRGEYRRSKLANKKSYLWDRLIDKFSTHYLGGTLAPIPADVGRDGRLGGAEYGLRYMALEDRVRRRAHSEAILGAGLALQKSKSGRFFRAMLPPEDTGQTVGFCILLLEPDGALSGFSYDDYRRIRAKLLSAYTEGLLEKHRYLTRMIGIATEGPKFPRSTEDLVYHEPPVWTPEAVEHVRERLKSIDILGANLTERQFHVEEYPETDLGLRGSFLPIPYSFFSPPEPVPRKIGNRQERRARAAMRRKRF